MLDDARERLAKQQEALVAALLSVGPVPPGFDPESIARAGRSLANKRRKDAAKRDAPRPGRPSPPAKRRSRLQRLLGRG